MSGGLGGLVCLGHKPRPGENAEDERRAYYEGVGDGVTLCPK